MKVRDVVETRLTPRRLFLSRQTGNDPALTGLLRVFKDYYPEIIVGDATRGKASAFKVCPPGYIRAHGTYTLQYPDTEWREQLETIQRAHAELAISRSERPLDGFRVARHQMNGVRGSKGALVPEVHTSHVAEVCTAPS